MLEPSPDIVNGIIGKLKTNGMFDEMRRSCLADIDTKVSYIFTIPIGLVYILEFQHFIEVGFVSRS